MQHAFDYLTSFPTPVCYEIRRRPADDDGDRHLEGLGGEVPAGGDGAAPAAFWGWDCCGPQGLLERVYSSLGVPQRSWHGLKCCPETGGGGSSQGARGEHWRLVRPGTLKT